MVVKTSSRGVVVEGSGLSVEGCSDVATEEVRVVGRVEVKVLVVVEVRSVVDGLVGEKVCDVDDAPEVVVVDD